MRAERLAAERETAVTKVGVDGGDGAHFWYSMHVSQVMVKPAGTGRPILLLHTSAGTKNRENESTGRAMTRR